MARVRLLTDTPEGAKGDVRVVSHERALNLVRIGQAERVIDREVPIERAVTKGRKRGDSAG